MMMAKILKKLRSAAGETLVESLVTILIITMVLSFLVSSIVIAAKINNSVKTENASIDLSQAQSAGSVSVKISDKTVTGQLYEVQSDDGEVSYYYYEAEPPS